MPGSEAKLNPQVCVRCGTANEPDLELCKKCGARLAEQEHPTVPHTKEEMSPQLKDRNGEPCTEQQKECAVGEDCVERENRQSSSLIGRDYFEKCLTMILSGQGNAEERIELLDKALSGELPLDEKIKAHAFLGAELFSMGKDEVAIDQYEKSLTLAIDSIDMFRDETMASLCRKLCHRYVSMAATIREEGGPKEALTFLEAKALILQDLSSPEFCVELATLLANKGDNEKASIYFTKAAKGRTIDDADSTAIEFARQSLSEIAKRGKINIGKIKETVEPHTIVSPKMQSGEKMPEQIKKSILSLDWKKKGFKRYVLLGLIIFGLFMVVSFISLYLSPVKPEPGVNPVAEKTEPPQSPPPPRQPPSEPPPPPQPPPPQVDTPKPEKAVAPEPAPKPRAEQPRAQPRQTTKTAKTEKPVKKVITKTPQQTTDRPPEQQRGKSFAPHSRDDL